jgi:LysR family glycine cleavage system transcriptional activator
VRQSSVRGLRTFCVAARCLSFKAAAEQLCVTPSAVSHQMKGLEQQLETRLFERRTREIALTEHGRQLFAEVEPLLLELDRVTRRFMQQSGQTRSPDNVSFVERYRV